MPETQYALSGDVNIAYQVFGEGDLNVVMILGAFTHLGYAICGGTVRAVGSGRSFGVL